MRPQLVGLFNLFGGPLGLIFIQIKKIKENCFWVLFFTFFSILGSRFSSDFFLFFWFVGSLSQDTICWVLNFLWVIFVLWIWSFCYLLMDSDDPWVFCLLSLYPFPWLDLFDFCFIICFMLCFLMGYDLLWKLDFICYMVIVLLIDIQQLILCCYSVMIPFLSTFLVINLGWLHWLISFCI